MRVKNTLVSAFVALLLVGGAASARAQLPDTFNGWETKSSQRITARQVPQFAGADAAVVREYGFDTGEHRQYAKDGAKLDVTLWKMKDTTGAFGLFTFYRDIGTASLVGPDRVAVWPKRLLIQKGPYLVDAQGAKLTVAESGSLLAKVPRLPKDETILPSLPTFLPSKGMIPESAKFVVGPVALKRIENQFPASAIDFDLGTEVVIARYTMGGDKMDLLLASYPTPQLAAKKLRSFRKLSAIAEAKPAIVLERKGSIVACVLGSTSPAIAKNLLHNIRYEDQVTWNQYVPTRRDNVGELIVNIFVLVGILLFFALVAGLSFGGLRILAKKFLPFPIFDRPSQIEIIRLHLFDR